MNSTEKNKDCRVILAPGVADASEGLVYLDSANVPCCRPSAVAARVDEQAESQFTCSAERQPGEGYWAVAPGCADISEGMVWVAALKESKQEGSRAAA